MAKQPSAEELFARLADAANDEDDAAVADALQALEAVPEDERAAAVNSADEDGETALHAAARGCYGRAVRQLIAWGADAGVAAGDGDTALANALWAGRWRDGEDAALALIAAGSDVMVRDRFDLLPLHHAAATGSPATVEALLAAGAQVMALDGRGVEETPLHCAAEDGNARVIPALLAAGAETDALNADGLNALYLAVQYGHRDAARALIAEGSQLDLADGMGRTPAHFAAYNGDDDILADLQAAGADPEARDAHGLSVADILNAFAEGAAGDRRTRLTVFVALLLQNSSGGPDYAESSFIALYHEKQMWRARRFERLCAAVRGLAEGRSYRDPLPRVLARLCHDTFEYLVVAVTCVVVQGHEEHITGIDPDELYDRLDDFKLAFISYLTGEEGFPAEVSVEALVAEEMALVTKRHSV